MLCVNSAATMSCFTTVTTDTQNRAQRLTVSIERTSSDLDALGSVSASFCSSQGPRTATIESATSDSMINTKCKVVSHLAAGEGKPRLGRVMGCIPSIQIHPLC